MVMLTKRKNTIKICKRIIEKVKCRQRKSKYTSLLFEINSIAQCVLLHRTRHFSLLVCVCV